MIKLTKREAITYEGLKQGLTLKDIAVHAEVNIEAVRHYVRLLQQYTMIQRFGTNRRNYYYKVIPKPYTVGEKEPKPRTKMPFDSNQDKLLNDSMNVKLTDDEAFYLKQHRSQSRTRLAKRLGLTKLQVCFAIERLG